MGLKPMNCPGHCAPVRAPAVVLPRPAGALLRARAAAPQRALRRAARPAARAPLRPGRRPRLLHRGPDPGRGRAAAWTSPSRPTRVFGFDGRTSSSRPAPRTGSATTRCGTTPRGRWSRRCDDAGPRRTRSTRATARSTGRRSTCTSTDSLGRSWQLGTVQLDYSMPERFGLTYTGADNAEHTPVMIHRALMGSYERFIGILLEHTAGELPLWLTPVQAIVLPIADRHAEVAAGGARRAARGRRARGARRPHRVGRPQDPRGRAAQDALHARRRRPRGRGGHGRRAPPRSATRARCAVASGAIARADRRRLAQALLGGLTRRGLRDDAAYSERSDAVDQHHSLHDTAAPFLTRATTASAGPSQVRPAPAGAGHHPDQRAHPRSRGPAHRRDGPAGRRHEDRRGPALRPGARTSTSSRSRPRPAARLPRPGLLEVQVRAGPEGQAGQEAPDADQRPRDQVPAEDRRARLRRPRRATSSASCATRTRSRSRSCSAGARSRTPSAAR